MEAGERRSGEMTFYVVRHGQTLFNVMGKVQGWCDTPLTDEGVRAAQSLGRGLAEVDFSAAYSSDSGRAVHTLDELLRAIDAELDKGTRRVTIHLPYDKGGWLDSLYREAKVESVEYGETIDIVAGCTPRVLGRVKDYVEGYTEPKEDWE